MEGGLRPARRWYLAESGIHRRLITALELKVDEVVARRGLDVTGRLVLVEAVEVGWRGPGAIRGLEPLWELAIETAPYKSWRGAAGEKEPRGEAVPLLAEADHHLRSHRGRGQTRWIRTRRGRGRGCG